MAAWHHDGIVQLREWINIIVGTWKLGLRPHIDAASQASPMMDRDRRSSDMVPINWHAASWAEWHRHYSFWQHELHRQLVILTGIAKSACPWGLLELGVFCFALRWQRALRPSKAACLRKAVACLLSCWNTNQVNDTMKATLRIISNTAGSKPRQLATRSLSQEHTAQGCTYYSHSTYSTSTAVTVREWQEQVVITSKDSEAVTESKPWNSAWRHKHTPSRVRAAVHLQTIRMLQ